MNWWSQPSDPRWWASLFAGFCLSALIVWISIRYARWRKLIDYPGQRRSHSMPTPRGGGIGIVIVFLVALVASGWLYPSSIFNAPFASVAALIVVAVAGWIDDHRGLSARCRLLAQTGAVTILLWPWMMYALSTLPSKHWLEIVAIGALGLALLWSINLHNFMDGINGLLACQAIFVFCASGALLSGLGRDGIVWPLAMFAAAVAGFLPFNFPHARIFMGDVGSGAIGLLVGLAVVRHANLLGFAGLIACSAFVTDATCTLLSRILRGRRWYSAHREHLYQWLARSGFTHAGVVALYMGWNLLIVTPVLYWGCYHERAGSLNGGSFDVRRGPDCYWAIAIYALAVALWIFIKRWCLHKVKSAAAMKTSS